MLSDTVKVRETLTYMGAKRTRVSRHGAAPDGDLPTDTAEAQAKASGFETAEAWQRERTAALCWERWRFDRAYLAYDERLASVADEFNITVEDAYDLLAAEMQREYVAMVHDLTADLAAIQNRELAKPQREQLLREVQARLDVVQAEADEGLTREQWCERRKKKRRAKA